MSDLSVKSKIVNNQVCRLCLSMESCLLLDIFQKFGEFNAFEIIMQFELIEINSLDKLPKKICESCFQTLSDIQKFKWRCSETQLEILKLLDMDDCDTRSNQSDLIGNPQYSSFVQEQINPENLSSNKNQEENLVPEDLSEKEHFVIEPAIEPNEIVDIPSTVEDPPAPSEAVELVQENEFEETHSDNEPFMDDDCIPEVPSPSLKIENPENLETPPQENSSQFDESNTFQGNVVDDIKTEYFSNETSQKGLTDDDNQQSSSNSDSEPMDDQIHEQIKVENFEEEEYLECQHCGKTYKREAHLRRHLVKHKEPKKLSLESFPRKKRLRAAQCNKCGKYFSQPEVYERHKEAKNCVPKENPKCRYCVIALPTIDDLERHLEKLHPKGKEHLCPICNKSFHSRSNRNTHIQSHNEINTFKCDICDQGFKSTVYLSKHKKALHMKSHNACPYCELSFDSQAKYEYHLKSHSPDKKYKCKFCEKQFLQHHHLQNHERTHTGDRPYLCNICGKDFKQECNFKLHLRIHENKRYYCCTICGKDFIQRGSFVVHMKHHENVKDYLCNYCGKNFSQKSSLLVHLRMHAGVKPHACTHCDKTFVQYHQLKYHNHVVHNIGSTPSKKSASSKPPEDPKPKSNGKSDELKPKVLPYICHICNKGFKLPSTLSKHQQTHSENRKHVCNQCSASFKRAEHLKIHVNSVHLKQRPYKCEHCDKSFAQAGDRNIHMKRHFNERPHVCKFCNKSFRLLKAMKAHVRIHTGEKPFSCEICKLDFMTYTALANHTAKHAEGATCLKIPGSSISTLPAPRKPIVPTLSSVSDEIVIQTLTDLENKNPSRDPQTVSLVPIPISSLMTTVYNNDMQIKSTRLTNVISSTPNSVIKERPGSTADDTNSVILSLVPSTQIIFR